MSIRLNIILGDVEDQALDHICRVAGKTKTDVVKGMILHWEEVVKDHEARGFIVVPTGDFKAVLLADRKGVLDNPLGPNISTEMPRAE